MSTGLVASAGTGICRASHIFTIELRRCFCRAARDSGPSVPAGSCMGDLGSCAVAARGCGACVGVSSSDDMLLGTEDSSESDLSAHALGIVLAGEFKSPRNGGACTGRERGDRPRRRAGTGVRSRRRRRRELGERINTGAWGGRSARCTGERAFRNGFAPGRCAAASWGLARQRATAGRFGDKSGRLSGPLHVRAGRWEDARRRRRVQRFPSSPLGSDEDVAHHSDSESVDAELDGAGAGASSLTRPSDVRFDPRCAGSTGDARGGACTRKYCRSDVCIRPPAHSARPSAFDVTRHASVVRGRHVL